MASTLILAPSTIVNGQEINAEEKQLSEDLAYLEKHLPDYEFYVENADQMQQAFGTVLPYFSLNRSRPSNIDDAPTTVGFSLLHGEVSVNFRVFNKYQHSSEGGDIKAKIPLKRLVLSKENLAVLLDLYKNNNKELFLSKLPDYVRTYLVKRHEKSSYYGNGSEGVLEIYPSETQLSAKELTSLEATLLRVIEVRKKNQKAQQIRTATRAKANKIKGLPGKIGISGNFSDLQTSVVNSVARIPGIDEFFYISNQAPDQGNGYGLIDKYGGFSVPQAIDSIEIIDQPGQYDRLKKTTNFSLGRLVLNSNLSAKQAVQAEQVWISSLMEEGFQRAMEVAKDKQYSKFSIEFSINSNGQILNFAYSSAEGSFQITGSSQGNLKGKKFSLGGGLLAFGFGAGLGGGKGNIDGNFSSNAKGHGSYTSTNSSKDVARTEVIGGATIKFYQENTAQKEADEERKKTYQNRLTEIKRILPGRRGELKQLEEDMTELESEIESTRKKKKKSDLLEKKRQKKARIDALTDVIELLEGEQKYIQDELGKIEGAR